MNCERQIFYFEPCSSTASAKFFVFTFAEAPQALNFLFSPLRNGDRCWNGRGGACVPARTSAQRRFHTKNTCIVRWEWMMDAPLQGDTGRHTGTAPTKLHHTLQSAYNQRPLRPPSCKTIHHLEMNERQGPCVRRIPTPSRIEPVVTKESTKSRAFVYFCTAKIKSDKGGGPIRICESTLYFRERYITRCMNCDCRP